MLVLNDEIMNVCERLVMSIVNKYGSNYNREDLYQVGINKVVEMSKSFDPNMGVKFSTYVYKHILGEILKYIRDDKNIRVSRDVISLSRKIKNVSDDFYSSIGRYPNVLELSNLIGESPKKIEDALTAPSNVDSLDRELELDDGSVSIIDRVTISENVDKLELMDLKYALENLKEDEKNLIYQRYYEGKTQTEIAKEINQSQVKVYRMERKILDELYEIMKVS